MEVNYNENGENNEDGEEDSEVFFLTIKDMKRKYNVFFFLQQFQEEEENTESDEDDYGAYTVASKEDFVHVETKTKVSTMYLVTSVI